MRLREEHLIYVKKRARSYQLHPGLKSTLAEAGMDQDFHYYGTYYAATTGGFSKDEATLIAKASNFIDFLNEDYPSPWSLIGGKEKYTVTPRYTFQGGIFQQLLSPQDGVWCVYHFTPGNYSDPTGSPSREDVHGTEVAGSLPTFQIRDTDGGKDILGNKFYYPFQYSRYLEQIKLGRMLNRPQSGLSREMIMDTIKCATSESRLRSILGFAIGGEDILAIDANIQRFRLLLLGVRAHVLADTWAHQDFCGLDNVLNTYWDVNYSGGAFSFGRQSINYTDGTTSGWANKVLSSTYGTSSNFVAAPNGTSYLGHGWMGHFPDFSFVSYQYKPCWANPKQATVRDNPREYQSAWMELVSLFNQSKGNGYLKLDKTFQERFDKALVAIRKSCHLEGAEPGRSSSAKGWLETFGNPPATIINATLEPDPNAVLEGRTGSNVRIDSDLYLFQIAADYHYYFIKHYLSQHKIYNFTGTWGQQRSALSPDVSSLF